MMFDEAFRRDGYLLFERLFDPDLIAAIREALIGKSGGVDPDNPPPNMRVYDGRLHMAAPLSGPLLDPFLYAHPLVMRVLETLFEQRQFLIDNVALVTALQGAPAMPVHKDHGPLFSSRPELDAALPPYAITLGIPLIPTDEKTGTTRIFAGSIGADYDEANAQLSGDLSPVDMHVEPGGAFLMDYRVYHSGLANQSRQDRPILYIIYSRPWFTDIGNFETHSRLAITREGLASVPGEHRHLFRRVAAAGLIDDTIGALGLEHPSDEKKPSA